MFKKNPYDVVQNSSYHKLTDAEKIQYMSAYTLNTSIKNIFVSIYYNKYNSTNVVKVVDTRDDDVYFFIGLTISHVKQDMIEFFGSHLFKHFIVDLKTESFKEI